MCIHDCVHNQRSSTCTRKPGCTVRAYSVGRLSPLLVLLVHV